MTLANAPAQLVVNLLAAKGNAESVTMGTGHKLAWNTDTGTKKGDILATATTVRGAPIATLCHTLERAKPWSLVAVPLRSAVVAP